MNQATAIVLDPDQNKRDAIRMNLSRCGVLSICFADEWICLENILHIKPTFAVFRPTSSEMAIHFIHIARVIERTLPIIIISKNQALQQMVCKPWLTDLFFLSDPAAQSDLQEMIDSFGISTSDRSQSMLIAGSPVARKCFNRLQPIGLSHEPVLIQGEPGVGKRLIARTIHHCSAAKGKLCRSVPAREISESWIRGLHRRMDRFPQSDSPLIYYFLENVEELNDQMQSQLLLIMDTLATKGNSNGCGMPVRFIFLTEADLSQLSRNGLFRKDLYYRLTVLTIRVPALRDRREDISLLADFFTVKYSLEKQRSILRLPETIRAAFREYDWPGNVTELEETIKKAMGKGAHHWVDDLNQWCRDHAGQPHRRFAVPAIDIEDCLRKLMDGNHKMSLKTARQQCVMQVEKEILKTVLFRTKGNCKKAAGLLNISYKSMLNKAKIYDLVD